jgi:universal stress protein A
METRDYAHLLLAVDFEPESELVIARAQRLRDLLGARLTLLHVVEHIPAAVELGPMGLGGEVSVPEELALEEELVEVAKRQMTALGQRLAVPEADRLVRVGPTAHTIDETAAEVGADLVVVGGRGRHGIMRLFGSTAKGVLKELRCDVLCVRIDKSAD